jgi:hypothetical protein
MARRVLLGVLGVAACAAHVIPPAVPPIPAEAIVTSVFLIGDAGAAADSDKVLLELERQAKAAPRSSVIIFLGDNVYPRGLPDPQASDRPEMERRLQRQIDVAIRSGIKAYFLSGNHDWFRMGKDGWDAVRRSETFIKERGRGLALQAPRHGCPGPESYDEGPVFRIVLLDTQWWLQKGDFPKARDSVSTCVEYTEEAVIKRLAQVLADTAGGKQMIVAGHNPLATRGEHGGHFSLRAHLFPLTEIKPWLWIPLPLLGSIYPVARSHGLFGYSQDLSATANRHMRTQLMRAMAPVPPLLYAAGHDHSLQIFRGPVARYTVVSGTGMEHHIDPPGWGRSTIYAAGKSGFMRADVDRQRRVRLSVTVIEGDGAKEDTAIWLTEPEP